MKLYEISEKIEAIMDSMEVDEETGEVIETDERTEERLMALDMERKDILGWLAKLALNARAEAAALREEEQRLRGRRARKEREEQRLLAIIDRECAGVKTDLGVATASYRRTTRLEVGDEGKACRWLKRHGHSDCYRTPEPVVLKPEVKRLVQNGEAVPGCLLVEGLSFSLK